jgi:proteasome lid subunit RPN8/RPN11
MENKIGLKIVMHRKARDKIDWLSINYDKEIGAFILGKVDKGIIRIEDILIPTQEADAGSVDITGKNLVKLKMEHPEECERIIGEWHSHHSMGHFYSSTDNEDFIGKWMAPRKIGVFIVSSKGKHNIRVELREPFFISMETEAYELEGDESVANELKKEIESKVTVPKYSGYSGGYGMSSWSDGYQRTLTPTKTSSLRDIDEEKAIKQHVGSMVVYMQHENSVQVRYLDYDMCEFLETEFALFESEVREENGYFVLTYSGFEAKEAAIQLMKDLRDCLKELFLNQIPGYGGSPQQPSMGVDYD